MRILFADDDRGIQQVAKLALERVGGFIVEICGSGSQLVSRIPAFSPDLIILDVIMPDMDGVETLKVLRDMPEAASVPVIFLTAGADPEQTEHYKSLGALDVIAKPFDPMTISGAISEVMARKKAVPSEDVMREFMTLRNAYSDDLSEKIQKMEDICRELSSGDAKSGAIEKLHLTAHSLAGSGETFGFSSLSRAARDLERMLYKIKTASGVLREEDVTEIGALISDARQACEESTSVENIFAEDAEDIDFMSDYPSDDDKENRAVLIVSDDAVLSDGLARQIGFFGYKVGLFSNMEDMIKAVAESRPAAIVADISFNKGGPESLSGMRNVEGKRPPVIFVADSEDMEARLRAVRAGGVAYFIKPPNMSELIDKLDSLAARRAREPYRILIVDDDPALAAHHGMILRRAGMETSVISDPLQMKKQLAEFRPELILMDVYMPGCSGMELAKVIRQIESLVSIPIVFLSSEMDVEKRLSAMSLGGDDFLTKPIKPGHLISSVKSRVERYRILRSFMIRDSLTGLLNHTKTKEQLDIEVARVSRHNGILSFALIDIDHFKAVNDTHGHFTGDQVLKSLSRLFQQRLRKTDVIGRTGGEEFSIILSDTDGPAAESIMNGIRKDFSKIRHRCKEGEFSVTFSCGIACYPAYGSPMELNEAADDALYEAKRKGRNLVVVAAPK